MGIYVQQAEREQEAGSEFCRSVDLNIPEERNRTMLQSDWRNSNGMRRPTYRMAITMSLAMLQTVTVILRDARILAG